MTWTTPATVTTGQLMTAAFWNANVRDDLNDLDSRVSGIEPVMMQAASVDSAQSRTGATGYGDLATVGPTVTLTTSTLVWVDLSAEIFNVGGGAGFVYMGIAVSGASTVTPSTSSDQNLYEGALSVACTRAYGFRLAVSGGSNTFTCKYQGAGANNPTFGLRHLRVTRLN